MSKDIIKELNIKTCVFSVFILIFMSSNFSFTQEKKKKVYFYYKVQQFGKYGDKYEVTIYKDGTIKTTFSEVDLAQKFQIIEQKEGILSEEDLKHLKLLLEWLDNQRRYINVQQCSGCWLSDFKIGRKRFYYNFFNQTSSLENIFDFIIKTSPLKIELYWGGSRPK